MKATSDLVKAQKDSKSLRTTIPKIVVEGMGLTEKDQIEWELKIRDNKIVGAEVKKA